MSTLHAEALEHAITRALIEELAAAGYVPVKVWDGEEYVPTTDECTVLDAVFAVDDNPTIHFASKATGENRRRGVLVVPGNGADFISNWHCGDKVFDQAVERACDRIEAGHVVTLKRAGAR